MKRLSAVLSVAIVLVAVPGLAFAQVEHGRVRLGAQVTTAVFGQLDLTDVGVGGRFSWHPIDLVGADAEVNVYPRDFPGRLAFTRGRIEGLFGVTVGPAFDRVRPFARVRAGWVRVREAPEPIACILIFPPPLSCRLADGRTLAAFDIGGGLEIFATPRTFVRVDAGDRLLRYPGPVLGVGGAARGESFLSHDFRVAAGGGLRF